MPTGTPYTFGYYIVKQGKEKDFKSLWENFARETGKHYRIPSPVRLLQNPENPQQFISFAEWSHLNDIRDWREQQYYKEFIQQAQEFCDTVDRQMYSVTTEVPVRTPDFEKVKTKGR